MLRNKASLNKAKSVREQNERARLTLEYDLLSRLTERFVISHFLSLRRAAAKHLLDNVFVEDDMAEVPPLDIATQYVCDCYEEVGEMLRVGVLRPEPVWSRFGYMAQAYWLLCKPSIEKMREEWQQSALYEDLEYLYRVCRPRP